MQELKVLTNPTPPEGFRWQVVGPDGKTIKSGTAKTQVEAQIASVIRSRPSRENAGSCFRSSR